MAREPREQDLACAIAQAAAVIGDWWSLLIVREVTRGHHRFEELLAELGISRKVLTERLRHLVEHGVLARRPYQTGPTRHEYLLTGRGRALAPVLISMQDWADRWLLADGSLTGTAAPDGREAARVHALAGAAIPGPLPLPAVLPPRAEPGEVDVVAPAGATVIFTYPATGRPGPLPPDWDQVPGAAGCTLENRLFRDIAPELAAAGVTVHGISTQRPDEQRAFALAEGVTFPLLSDAESALAAALRLPTFRTGQTTRLKRLILVADPARTVRLVIYPVLDIPAAVAEARAVAARVAAGG
ncbi:hypothetical protein Sru01_01710 [Sphaerisporangium rufum]|uniref:HxlR family transcriptional regulator n=1 Tax=Sphaerisporangium rufum TaxID=1381558 RepID=A0A919QW19_9ACTN|nr:winged helix-turn-helix transcriptional regulator [Sphaerisporangium rufum]GII75189.1 hypothetical protein Sru01_01710 [Sphaerisporangium rufum]